MRFKFLFLWLFLKSAFVFSQNEYQKSVDSLQAIINKETNEYKKIKPYVALCNLYKNYSNTKCIACNEQLLLTLQKTKSTTEYGFYYNNKAHIYFEDNNSLQATIYAEKATILFYKNKDWDNYILNCVEHAIYLGFNDKRVKAMAVLQKALAIAKNTKSKNIARVYYGFCCMYSGSSDFTLAIEYAKKAIVLEKNTTDKAKIYHQVAHIYNLLGNYKSALEYNELAIRNCNTSYLSTTFKLHKARVLFNMRRNQEALTIAVHCHEYFKKNSYVFRDDDAIYFISECYFTLKKYHLANQYIDEALKSKFKRRIRKIRFKSRKAKISLALNDTKTSKKYIDEALSLLKDSDFFELKLKVYNIKVQLEKAIGNYKIALYYNNKIVALKDANSAHFNKNKLHQLQVDLDVTEKNNSIKNLQITQLQKQAEINTKNKYLMYFFCALIVCVVGLLIFLYTYNIIKIKNSIIEANNLKLAEKSNKIQKSLQEKETLLKEIHHRVKNNMQLVMSLLYLQSREKGASMEEFLEISQSRIISMSLIHENLYQTGDLSIVDFKIYVDSLIQSIIASSNSVERDIQLHIDIADIFLNIQTAIPLGLIINELITNAYKHAFVKEQKGSIALNLIAKEDGFELTIKDNGVGMSKTTAAKKTFGLELVKQLVAQLSGALQIENEAGMQYQIQFKNIVL